jgi:hypothetical protein
MLRSAGIDPEEFNKHKGAAVKAVEFYQNMINVQPRTLHLLHLRISFCVHMDGYDLPSSPRMDRCPPYFLQLSDSSA